MRALRSVTSFATAAALLWSCNSSKVHTSGSVGGPADMIVVERNHGATPVRADATITNLVAEPHALTVEVRANGVNVGADQKVYVAVKELEAWAGSTPLKVEIANQDVNLANTAQAWLLGTVQVPPDAKDVRFRVLFDDFGAYQAPGIAGDIDMRHAPVSWSAPLSYLQRNSHAVVSIDLARSLVPATYGERKFLPNLSIHY